MRANTDRMLAMIDAAVAGSAPFLPVRLVVFPEFAHAAPVFATVDGAASRSWRCRFPTSTPTASHAKAREHGIYIQTGSMIEVGSAMARRRVQHDLPDRSGRHPLQVPESEPVDSVRGSLEPARARGLRRSAVPGRRHADRPDRLRDLLRLAFPEAIRQLAANGAEVLVRVSAYMDPWGATEPMNWWTIVNRCRALENTAFVVAANQGASLQALPAVFMAGRQPDRGFRRPDSRRSLTRSRRADRRRADRHHRASPRTRDAPRHNMLAHLRTEAYPVYAKHQYPPLWRTVPRTDVRAE